MEEATPAKAQNVQRKGEYGTRPGWRGRQGPGDTGPCESCWQFEI